MKKHIHNPYENIEDYYCFGCSSKNKLGLQLQFTEEGEYIVSNWVPEKKFEGWMGVLHGGIQASLLDEIGSWLVFVKLGTAGVTAELNVQYKKPVKMTTHPITIKAWLTNHKMGIAFIEAELIDHEGCVCSKSSMKYYIFDEKTAADKYYYPGKDKFYQHP